MTNRRINGDRVKQAREIKGYTQEELADLIGVSQSTIAHIEKNSKQQLLQPSDTIIEAIAFRTGFSAPFFYQESGPEFPLGSLLYRSRQSTLKRQDKYRAHQLGRLVYEIAEKMAKRVSTIPIRVPRVGNESPIVAARLTRAELGLSPDRPVKNLLHQLEKNGVFVLALPIDINEQDAYCVWSDTQPRRPVIILSNRKPGDHRRFSLAHELGHLVMHHSFPGGLRKIEDEADQFASEFLMPEEVIRSEITTPVTLTSLGELKPRWGVSILALILRAKNLEIITDRQARYLYVQRAKQQAKNGWDKEEPPNLHIEPEKPRAFKRMAELLHGVPINAQKVAAYNLTPSFLIRDVMAAHADKPDMPRATKKAQQGSNVVSIRSKRQFQGNWKR